MPNLFSSVQDPLIQGTGTVTDYETTALERFGAEFGGALDTNPLAQGARMARYGVEANARFFGLDSNMVSPEVAKEELKSRGLEGHITVPEGGMSRVEFDSIQYLKQRELSRQAKSAMNQSTFAHIAGFAGGLAGSAIDPINIASAFVPIVREARIEAMLAKAGSSMLGRAGVRAQVGATEGVVGALMIEPFTYAMSQYEQMDYTPADSFMNVVFGGLLGGGLHMAGGAVYDWRATRAMNSLQRGLDSMNMRDMAPDVQDEVQLDILRRFTEAEENGAPLPDADEIIAQRMTPDQRSAVREADEMPGEVPTPTRADGQPSQPRGLDELIPEAKADRTAETFNRQFLDKEQGDVSGFSDVRPPREDIFEVAQANFVGRTQHTAKTVPIDKLYGGVSADPAEAKRVSNLVELMSGPNGYLERLIVDTEGNVIEGQHRLEALRKMGIKEVPVIEIRDLREGLPVDQMMDAMRQVRGLHREQAGQIVDQIAEAIADVGSVAEVRAQYAPPRGFERAWEAALNAAEAADDLKAQSAPAKDASGKFTEAFWRWFKDSKVVDEDGNPLVVYHGGSFDQNKDPVFKRGRSFGFFFTPNKKKAQSYAPGMGRDVPVTEVYLSLQNPFMPSNEAHVRAKWVKDWIDFWRERDGWVDRQTGETMEDYEVFQMIEDTRLYEYEENGMRISERWDDFLRTAQDHHDGFYGYDPTDGAVIAAAFEPTQIKSATGNRGTYDPELADIRAQSDVAAATSTPAFKRWFRNSKLVDENGNPRVLYHATPEDFTEFKAGGLDPDVSGHAIWLGTSKTHQPAMHNIHGKGGFKTGTNVMPVYARVERPLVLDTKEMLDWAADTFANGNRDFPLMMRKEWADEVTRDGEYDGIIFDGEALGLGPHGTEIIVFDPKQIKSAIGNSGNYDPELADIRAQSDVFGPAEKTDTPKFKRFFKQSVVANPDGSPRVVYTGTDVAEDFTEFAPGTWFTEHPDEASAYSNQIATKKRNERAARKQKFHLAKGADDYDGQRVPYAGILEDATGNAPVVGKVYATDNGVYRYREDKTWDVFEDLVVFYRRDGGSFQYPDTDAGEMVGKITIKKGDGKKRARKVVIEDETYLNERLEKNYPGGFNARVYPVYLSIQNPKYLPPLEANRLAIRLGADRQMINDAIAKYKAEGYDGIVTESDEATMFPEVQQAFGGVPRQYIVFEPSQAKSASGNSGEYDPDVADMRAQSDIVDDAAGPNSGLTPYTQSLGGQTDVNQPQSPDVLGTQETGLRLLTGVRRSPGILPPSPAWSDTAPLAYLPTTIKVPGVGTVEAGAFPLARRAARDYVESTGRAYDPITTYRKVDPARAGRIAEAFEQMRHEPDNPEVKAAYEAMVKETLAQWEAVKRTGLVVEFIDISKGDPYSASPRLATEDVRNNNHLWVFATDDGFGTDGITAKDESDNPLFQIVPGETISGKQVRANDIFRIVHDYFGHIKDGVGFRADGEENAWRSHSRMYSPQAARAMTTETRGQNSWLNYGPYGEKNRTALTQDTIFAEQKIGLLPDWVLWEGLDDLPLPVADDRTLADELGFGDLKMMGEPLDPADGPDAPKVIGTDAAGRPVLDFRNSVVSHFTDQESADNINEFGYRVVGDGYYGEAISFTPNREFGAQFGGVETTARVSPNARILQLGVDEDWKMFKAITGQRNVVMMNPRPGQKSWRQAFVEKGIDGVYDAGAGDLFIYNERVVRPTAMDGLGDLKTMIGGERAAPDTPEFKRWFDGSKVVDADGNPLILYHGTDADFTVFEPSESGFYGAGIYFTDDTGAASEFANRGTGEPDGDNVMPVYVAMKKPYIFDAPPADSEPSNITLARQILNKKEFRKFMKRLEEDSWYNPADEFRNVLEDMGHDGIIVNLPGAPTEYIAFHSEQIKSATGNSGAYDPDLADIRAQSDVDEPGVVMDEDGGIEVWHASPHDFDRFDLSKIGTGEGNQSYSHGLYFAESEEVSGVGGDYYKNFTNLVRERLGIAVEARYAEDALAQNKGDVQAAIADLKWQIERPVGDLTGATPDFIADLRRLEKWQRGALALLESGKPIPRAKVYKSKLRVRNDQLIDWDKSLAEQSPLVQQFFKERFQPKTPPKLDPGLQKIIRGVERALGREEAAIRRPEDVSLTIDNDRALYEAAHAYAKQKLTPEQYEALEDSSIGDWIVGQAGDYIDAVTPRTFTGDELMKAVFGSPTGANQQQAAALRDAGIKGLKYLDGNSRNMKDWLVRHPKGGINTFPTEAQARKYLEKNEGTLIEPKITSNYVIFDDEVIDIIDKFQSDLDEQPDLVAAHNLTAANLLHADRMGGIAAPSLAIAKASDGHEGYGEITLIGSKDLVDPQKGANVYAGDIYSARYPTVHYNIKYDSIRKLEKQFAATAKEMGVTLKDTLDDDALEREGPRALSNSAGAMLAYAKDKGIKVDGYLFDEESWKVRTREAWAANKTVVDEWQIKIDAEVERAKAEGREFDRSEIDAEFEPKYKKTRIAANAIENEPNRVLDDMKWKLKEKFRNDSGFAEWAEGKFAELKAKERIFKGFSNTTGAKMYTAHTLDNVVKLMTKKIRDAEGFNYGIGNLRAKVAPKFRSVEAIRGRKGSLVKREEFDAIKKEADAELISIADQLLPKLKYKGNSFGQLDALTQHMAEAIDRNNVKRVFQEYYNNLTDDDVRMVGNFLQKLKSMPTTYFEAKLDRAVQIGEFEAAIVPNTLSKKAREVLERSGVKQIIEYDPAVDGARQAAIDSIRDMKFQRDVVDVSAKDTVVAGPYTYTKMDTERRQRSEALRDAVEDLITKYTGGRAQMRWYSSISQKAGGKIHKVDGGFSSLRGLIIMALDAADMVGSAKHEALHFLKDRGLISDVEWDTLVRTALREGWMDKKYGGSKLTVRQRYAHLPNMLDILEEAIAEQFRAGRYDNFQGFHPAIRPVLIKLRKFFDAVAKEARKIFGMEATAEDIFRAIESGEIGRRADVEKAKVETAAIMDAPQRSAPQRMKNQSTPEEDPLRVDRWAADDIAIAAEATDDSKRKDETLQDIEADSAILGAHLESMRQRGLLSQEDEADLLASNDTARVMEEQAAAYEAAGICEGEE